ncbi:MAG: ATP-binding cassette domain-containing protein [Lachnospiraceae bacterium]|nr:ATP-binding cassette domain-containing protein [Lachnospiraceae bacterium]
MQDSDNRNILLNVKGLTQSFGSGKNLVKVLHDISFQIKEGEVYGLVGESGSGKSTIGKCIIGLNEASGGSISFDGKELIGDKKDIGIKKSREAIQMIFQDPMSSLNPRRKIGDIVGAGLDIQKAYSSKNERDKKVGDMLEKVGLPREFADRYPSQFSGGQRQRVGIARALIMNPKLVIADECIAALDASIQAQVVNMLKSIQAETKTAFLFISHDLSMVRYLSERIGVLHMGYLLETGTTDEIFKNPIHPYTRNLLAAIPGINPVLQKKAAVRYDYDTFGVQYENGIWHDVPGERTHRVLCTDLEAKKWGIKNDI